MADLTSGHFAQLTYTSFDNGAGRGGWQVKQEVGKISAAERETLTARISTVFDLQPALPDFPTEEQVLSRPARLVHGILADGSSVLWHTVDAGRDGSGRPGNVFAHIVVERPGPFSGVLPIERWLSSGWLRPYGPPAVAAAELAGAAPPPPNPAVGPAAAIAFASESMQQQRRLRALMDAVAARLGGGAAVVLQVPDHDAAVSWISAITHLLPPSAGRRLAWSTHDAPELAAKQIASGIDLVCIPTGTDDDFTVPGALLVSSTELPDLALPGGVHEFANGQSVVATELSELAEGVLADPDIAADVLRACADYDRDLSGIAASPIWITAAAVLHNPDLAEFHSVARRAVAKHAPAAVHQVPWAAEMVAKAQLEFPPSPDQMLMQLRAAAPSAALATKWCGIVLADGSWRTVPLATVPKIELADLTAMDDVLNAVLDEVDRIAAATPETALMTLLHLDEFLRRVGAPSATRTWAEESLIVIAKSLGVRPEPGFSNTGWPAVAPRSEIRPAAIAVLLRPCLRVLDDSQLRGLSAAFWLATAFNVLPEHAVSNFLPEDREPEDLAVYPYAVLALLTSPPEGFQPTSQQRTDLAIGAINACAKGKLLADQTSRDLSRELLIQAPAAAIHLSEWLHNYPRRVSGTGIRDAIVSGPADPAVLQTALSLDPSTPDVEGLIAIAQLRLWVLNPLMLPRSQQEYRSTVQRALRLPGLLSGLVAPDLLTALDAGVALADSLGDQWVVQERPTIDQLRRYVLGLEATTADWLRTMGATPGIPTPHWAVAQAFLGHVMASQTRSEPTRATVLAQQAMGTNLDPDLDAERLRDLSWPLLTTYSAADAEYFFKTYSKAANGWLRDHNPNSSGFRRS